MKLYLPLILAAFLLPGCFEGDRGPVGPAGQDAVTASYTVTVTPPTFAQTYTLPAWTADGDVFVAADVWLHSANFEGWSPINVIYSTPAENVFQAAMLVDLPEVQILNAAGQKCRIRAWEFAE